ncbi:MAG: TetR family transcriptional regulator [Pseudomonadota bacterium]
MSQNRKSAEAREKDLRLSMLRIKRGRSNTGATRVNFASVAREAGISPALIHNHYPKVADAIRLEQVRDGRGLRNRRPEKQKKERDRVRALRAEIADLRANVARLASINEVLRFENESLRAKGREDGVSRSPSQPLHAGSLRRAATAVIDGTVVGAK